MDNVERAPCGDLSEKNQVQKETVDVMVDRLFRAIN
jgi:hypothetical protein